MGGAFATVTPGKSFTTHTHNPGSQDPLLIARLCVPEGLRSWFSTDKRWIAVHGLWRSHCSELWLLNLWMKRKCSMRWTTADEAADSPVSLSCNPHSWFYDLLRDKRNLIVIHLWPHLIFLYVQGRLLKSHSPTHWKLMSFMFTSEEFGVRTGWKHKKL